MILTWPGALLLVRETELPFGKKGPDGVCVAGDDGPSDIESNVVVGMPVVADRSKLRRGLSVGGLGAGREFMNWSGVYSLCRKLARDSLAVALFGGLRLQTICLARTALLRPLA